MFLWMENLLLLGVVGFSFNDYILEVGLCEWFIGFFLEY